MDAATKAFKSSVLGLSPALSGDAWAYLKERLTHRELSAREVYISAGTVQKEIGFLSRGLLRAFYVDEEGKEITIRFTTEGSYATHYPSFLAGKPSRYTLQALEPSTLVCLSWEAIQTGYERFPSLERYGRRVAEEVLKALQHRIESLQFLDAEQRYRTFLAEEPQLFQRVSLTHLASYLGIERPSLSRIRKKMKEEEAGR